MRVDPILSDIEDALEVYEISATRFGYVVAGDPALVLKIRGGRRPRVQMRDRIKAALKSLAEEGCL